MRDKTGENLVVFWDWVADKGLANKNTAGALRSACAKVLEIEDNWQTIDVSEIDVDQFVQRFQNLRAAEYKPRTLDAYGRRFKNAVSMYLDYVADPSSWKPPGGDNGSRAKSGKGNESDSDTGASREHGTGRSFEAETIEYPFPLRDDRNARLFLPRDLKSSEVKRLSAFMAALAVDFDGDSGQEDESEK